MEKVIVLEKGKHRMTWEHGEVINGEICMKASICRNLPGTDLWSHPAVWQSQFHANAPIAQHVEAASMLLDLLTDEWQVTYVPRNIVETLTDQNYKELLTPKARQNKVTCRVDLEVDPKLLEKIRGYLEATDPADYQDEDDTIVCSARFPNGYQMDIKCCGSQDGPSWTEAVLFDDSDMEMTMTQPEEEFEGEWVIEHKGVTYEVNVVPMDCRPKAIPYSMKVPFPIGSEVQLENHGISGIVTGYTDCSGGSVEIEIRFDGDQGSLIGDLCWEDGQEGRCDISPTKCSDQAFTKALITATAKDLEDLKKRKDNCMLYTPFCIGSHVLNKKSGICEVITDIRYEKGKTTVQVRGIANAEHHWCDIQDLNYMF